MAQETEFKLEPTTEGAERIAGCSLLGEPAERLELHSIYFDTPERDLSEAGFTLRIRECGSSRVQTIKAAGTAAAGLFARPEWEVSISGDVPILDDTTPLRALLGSRTDRIQPLFDIRVERLVWNIDWQDARIEVALDRGEVIAGDATAPVCEIELELKGGDQSALFSFARKLDEIAPLRIGATNKAERGLRLLDGAEKVSKAGIVTLDPHMKTHEAFRQIATSCLRQYRLNENLLESGSAEAVHQARVALRRLRSAFSIFAPILRDEVFQHLRDEVKWLAACLGETRDLDVMISDAGLEADLQEKLQRRRVEAFSEALSNLGSARARTLMFDLVEWLAAGPWLAMESGADLREAPVRDFAGSALDRFRRKVRKGGRDLEALTDEERHEVRKNAKKLRYAADFFASLYEDKRSRRRQKRFTAALADLQEHLGELNDIATARNVLAAFDVVAAAAMLRGAEDRRVKLMEKASEAHDTFRDARPFWR